MAFFSRNNARPMFKIASLASTYGAMLNANSYLLIRNNKVSTHFERKFSSMITSIRNGTLQDFTINLREQPIHKKHIHSLALALADNFQVASSITEIDLSFTSIDALPEDIFKDCDHLRRLNLENNKLTELPALPDRPYALQDFVASFNCLKKIPEHYFQNCISLKTVYLEATEIEKAPNLADSLRLTWLHLDDNPIKKIPEKYFQYFDHLDTVFLNNTKLTELPDLSYCTRLHEVWINDITVPTQHIRHTAQVIITS